jgi:hypothetical protein
MQIGASGHSIGAIECHNAAIITAQMIGNWQLAVGN